MYFINNSLYNVANHITYIGRLSKTYRVLKLFSTFQNVILKTLHNKVIKCFNEYTVRISQEILYATQKKFRK